MVTLVNAKQIQGLIGDVPFRAWAKDGYIPVADTTSRSKYYLEYFQRLMVVSRGTPTRLHATLCTIEWYAELGYEDVIDRLDELCAAGKVYVSSQVGAMMGYDRTTIVGWVEKGFLPSIIVRRRHFFVAADVIELKKVMDGYTSYEVAELLGCALGSVSSFVRQGRLKATMTPGGLRFDAESLQGFSVTHADERAGFIEGWTSTSEVCEMLNVPPATLEHWIGAGVFVPTKINGCRYIQNEEVLHVKNEREALRGGFEVIKPVLEGEDYYSLAETASRLGISTHYTTIWTTEGLLPYYDPSPQKLRRKQNRMYVAWYVDSLVEYAEVCERQPSKVLARTYKQWAIEYYSTRH